MIFSHRFLRHHVTTPNDYLRALMFIIIAGVVAKLSQCISKTEEQREQYIYSLNQRLKELSCLYGFSKLIESSGGSADKILQGTVNLIPDSWQYPESICVRIVIDEEVYESENYQETIWKQEAGIKKHGEHIGILEVYYIDKNPESDEGPFLQEERNLIDAIAERLGHVLERIHIENELRDYREKMFRAEQLASLGTIGSAFAHQLNQPLSVIRMSIQKTLRNLHKTGCPEIVKEMLDDSLNEVSKASSVVKGFLALGHTSSKTRISNININKIAVKTAAIFTEMAKNNKIKLIIDDNLKKMPTIKGIAGEIEQMFFILVQNAIQAGKANKKQWFKISGSAKEDQIALKFSDNCGGIEPDNLDKIFESFFTTKPADQGTGLGLTILQQIVTNYNGSVRVDNEFGQGTTFYVTLPIKC